MATHGEGGVAYAKQAKADLLARERLLEHTDVADCQGLHFVQMACEKSCKADLCGAGADAEKLQSSHAYVAAVLPIIAREQFAQESQHREKDRTWVMRAIRKLARQIELLAPSVKGGGEQ